MVEDKLTAELLAWWIRIAVGVVLRCSIGARARRLISARPSTTNAVAAACRRASRRIRCAMVAPHIGICKEKASRTSCSKAGGSRRRPPSATSKRAARSLCWQRCQLASSRDSRLWRRIRVLLFAWRWRSDTEWVRDQPADCVERFSRSGSRSRTYCWHAGCCPTSRKWTSAFTQQFFACSTATERTIGLLDAISHKPVSDSFPFVRKLACPLDFRVDLL